MTCTELRALRRTDQRGFNMIELVMVMVLIGILAVYALPKMTSAISLRDDAWHDEVQSALRFAQKGAVARRRLACVTISSASVSVMTASANPASSCDTVMKGPDGTATFATSDNSSAGTSVSPSGTPSGVIYFQPDGRATLDGAGATSSTRTISMSGVSYNIVVYGETGYVQ